MRREGRNYMRRTRYAQHPVASTSIKRFDFATVSVRPGSVSWDSDFIKPRPLKINCLLCGVGLLASGTLKSTLMSAINDNSIQRPGDIVDDLAQ